ncbi:MAG: ABC transporter ATP-binding protein, partial [Ureaplasma sp.]|nr:ABC transporter ATP-binding protein [Ureaplasma sp.]
IEDCDKESIKSFKNDINIKLKTIDALTFEFNTIFDEITTYRDLRSKHKILVWLNLKDLIKILMKKRVYEALNSVGLKNEHAYRYPHEFSGGQRQRIVIARALINNPKIIIADEPISALDVSIQAQVINIMKDLAEKKGITFLFIAHDLSMVNYACNRMIIMHNGRILEKGDTQEIFNNPIHPYTLSLLRSAPQLSKIHIDLASGGIESSYGHFNLPSNFYTFHSVSKNKEHFVFGTDEQIKLWSKKTH